MFNFKSKALIVKELKIENFLKNNSQLNIIRALWREYNNASLLGENSLVYYFVFLARHNRVITRNSDVIASGSFVCVVFFGQ